MHVVPAVRVEARTAVAHDVPGEGDVLHLMRRVADDVGRFEHGSVEHRHVERPRIEVVRAVAGQKLQVRLENVDPEPPARLEMLPHDLKHAILLP